MGDKYQIPEYKILNLIFRFGNMKWILLFLLSASVGYAQETLMVELTLRESTKDLPISNRYVTFYHQSDSLTLISDEKGRIILSSADYPDFLKRNETYQYRIHSDFELTDNDLRDFNMKFHEGIDPVRILGHNYLLNYRGDIVLSYKSDTDIMQQSVWNSVNNILSVFENVPESKVILSGITSDDISEELAWDRLLQLSADLMTLGLDPYQIETEVIDLSEYYGQQPQQEEGYEYGIFCDFTYMNEDPCATTTGASINFDKKTDTLVNTQCESIQRLYEHIQSDPNQAFAIIGIYTQKKGEQPESNLLITREQAENRAKKVIKELIKLGISKKRLVMYTAYHKPPAPDDYHDWPFYPERFTYEIGVYLEVE